MQRRPTICSPPIGYGKVSRRAGARASSCPDGELQEKPPDGRPSPRCVKRVLRPRARTASRSAASTTCWSFRARCCNPIRGEKIVGYITPRQGRVGALGDVPERHQPDVRPRAPHRGRVGQARPTTARYTVRLTMQVEDRKGMLADVSAKVAGINTNITTMEATTDDDQRGRIDMTVEISDLKHLEKVIRSLKGSRACSTSSDRRDAGSSPDLPKLRWSDQQMTAMASISMRTSRGRRATWTVERAGAASGRRWRRPSFIAAKSFRSSRKTVVCTTCSKRRRRRPGRAEVLAGPAGLGGDVAVDDLARRGIEGDLPGEEQEVAGPDGLRIRADGLRAPASVAIASRMARSGGLDDLVRPHAARADAEALGRPVDDRPDASAGSG